MTKPFSQACANNQAPLFDVLKTYLTLPGQVIEVGSGTGQHAVYMATHLPHIHWQPTDRKANLAGIELWRKESALPNIAPALEYDVTMEQPPEIQGDHLFSANTLHIMSWAEVEQFFQRIPDVIKPGGYAFFYGPFKYNQQFTSASNQAFNDWLKRQAPHQGIRDYEAIAQLAELAGLTPIDDIPMPANNQTLVWQMQPR